MEDLIVWLRQQLDSDERVALNATQYRWIVSERREPATPEHQYGKPYLVASDEGFGYPAFRFKDEADAAHIARHDPAAVLADVAAKRKLVELHDLEWIERPERVIGEADDPWCMTCGEQWPCETIAALASAYRHRPGWNTDWE